MRANLRKPLGMTMAAVALSVTMIGCAKDETTTATTTDDSESTTSTTAAVNSGEIVEIKSVAGKWLFDPDDKVVKVNEAVVWKNTDANKHTITAKENQAVSFKSQPLTTDDEFVQTFAEPGTYTYFCSIHGEARMSGTITVEE